MSMAIPNSYHQSMWDSSPLGLSSDSHHNPLHNVAFSVAEAALSSGPNSPSCNPRMADLMDAPAMEAPNDLLCDASAMGTWPRQKAKRASSFTGRPLWELAQHAKERRERESFSGPRSFDPSQLFEQEITVLTTRSADPSPDAAFFSMEQLDRSLPRLSGRDFAIRAEKQAAAVAHFRTQSDALRAAPDVLAFRPNRRLPSLAQIQAKMNRMGTGRSDSMDSQDSDGPQTPTDENTTFFGTTPRRPMTPDSPSSRLAPFLRQRTHGRMVTRPKSMPPIFGEMDDLEDLPSKSSSTNLRQGSLPPTPQTAYRIWRQASLPVTTVSPPRSPPRTRGVTLAVTPPCVSLLRHSPTSPTESVASIASSALSLPIITCTPAAEQDSDEESEGDVIVFSGEPEPDTDDDDDEEDRRMREQAGLDMRNRLLRRSS